MSQTSDGGNGQKGGWIIALVIGFVILAALGNNVRLTHGDTTIDISRGGSNEQTGERVPLTELEGDAQPPAEVENIANLSPQEFLQSYYSTINERRIDSAWQLLTPQYQVNKAGGRESYIRWWESVRTVTIRDIFTINEEPPRVRVEISYLMMNGESVDEKPLIFSLIWNEDMNSWQINDSERLD